MAAFVIPVAVGGAHDSSDDVAEVPAAKCPEANAVFEKEGLPVPDSYSECPDPARLEADIDSAGVSAAEAEKANAVIEAVKAGLIDEGQDPKTYPESLKREIGLSSSGGG